MAASGFHLTSDCIVAILLGMKSVPWYTNFRRNLAAVIDARGISQSELARLSGIHVTTINRILNGHNEPTVTTAEKLAVAAGITAEKLFSENSEKSTKMALTA